MLTTVTRPPRVLIVTPRYAPFIGGVETHVYEVARRLATDEAFRITVLTTDPTGRLPSAERVEGIEIRRVRAWPTQSDYYFAPHLYQVVRHGGWDLVHCQGIHTLVPPLAMLAARRAHIPYVVTLHTGGHSSKLRSGLRDLQWSVLGPLLSGAERIIGVSEFEAKHVQRSARLDPARVMVIPNGSELSARPVSCPTLDDGLIVSVGRLERYKGHQRVLAALPAIRAEVPSARLLVLGGGPYERALRRQAKRLGVEEALEIRSLPHSDRGGMAAALARASLVTLFSDYEAHPLAVMEALAAGRPVLGTDTSGLRELAQRGLIQTVPLGARTATVAAKVVEQLRQPTRRPPVALPTWDDCAAALAEVYRREIGVPACAS